MVADFMSLGQFFLGYVRKLFDAFPDEEKGGLGVVPIKYRQQRFGVSARSIIKGQGNAFNLAAVGDGDFLIRR